MKAIRKAESEILRQKSTKILQIYILSRIFLNGIRKNGCYFYTPKEVPHAQRAQSQAESARLQCFAASGLSCEKESLLAAISKATEYYDDEELDRFRGRGADEYTEEETEEFRDVLYTMRSDEVAGWVRSLQLRQVELPDEVKDEVIMIVGERRAEPSKS